MWRDIDTSTILELTVIAWQRTGYEDSEDETIRGLGRREQKRLGTRLRAKNRATIGTRDWGSLSLGQSISIGPAGSCFLGRRSDRTRL